MKFAMTRKVSTRVACDLVKVSRRRLGYASRKNDEPLASRLKELAAEHRVTAAGCSVPCCGARGRR